MSDALKAIVIVAALYFVASMTYSYGYSEGLRASPEYAAMKKQRSAAEDADWQALLNVVSEDDTCRKIRDLVLQDQIGSENADDAGSPHKDR